MKYRAFLSCSHTDKKWGDWLHAALETYRVPRRLIGRESRDGQIPERLFPIFRDREELPTATNLTTNIEDALRQSQFLIVICSLHAARSSWIAEEIKVFKELSRKERILALIVEGEPNESLPPPLRNDAAHVRVDEDGKQIAKLKLVAALLGVSYDDLSRGDGGLFHRAMLWVRSLTRTKPVVPKSPLNPSGYVSAVAAKFKALERIRIRDGNFVRTISLWQGDLSQIPREHYVDMLIVSAFRGSYEPYTGTLIGALQERGLSIKALSEDKEFDLLTNCGFWISRPLSSGPYNLNIGKIVCFEPDYIGDPPEVVGHLFRGLFPFLDLGSEPVVALPLLATGQQQWNKILMLKALIRAAAEWMRRGLPLKELRIVLLDPGDVELLKDEFAKMKNELLETTSSSLETTPRLFDVFVSYSSKDTTVKDMLVTEMKRARKNLRIFDFKNEIDVGQSYQSEIDRSIESAKFVACILSPNYFASNECMEELHMARLRNKREAAQVLLPFYWKSCPGDLALWLQTLNLYDAREMRSEAVIDFVEAVCRRL